VRRVAELGSLGVTTRLGMTATFPDELRAALERACQAQNVSVITQGRREILAMQREAVVQSIESVAAGTLQLDDEWTFRRLLELYEQLDRGLLRRLIEVGLASSNGEVREAAEDFRLRL
jgi:hypothetical protein